MTLEPLPSEPANRPPKRHQLLIAVVAGLTAAGIGGFFYGRYFINQQLSPLIQAELNRLVDRPVSLGEVERFSFNGVRFGKSTLPATDSQQNFVVAEAIDVQIDLWNYWQTRQITLDLTVQSPQVFLRQDFSSGQYLPEFKLERSLTATESNIDLRTIKIDNAQLTLQAANTYGVITLTKLNLQSDWQITNPNRQAVQFSGNGQVVIPTLPRQMPTPEQLSQAIAAQPLNNGTLSINKGEWDLTRGLGNIQLRSQNIAATAVKGFFPNFPMTPLQGRVDAEVALGIKPDQTRADIQGNLRVRDVSIRVANLPKPLTNISGTALFDGTTVTLQGISANYTTLIGRIDGTANLQSGLNVDMILEPMDIAKALTGLGIKTSIPLTGEIKVVAKVIGKKPQITAEFVGTKPITVDRLVLNQVQGKIAAQDLQTVKFSQIRAVSAVGGVLEGGGLLTGNFSNPNLDLKFNLFDLNSEAIANLYETKLPIPIGVIAAQVEVSGKVKNSLDHLKIQAKFNAPQSLYPTQGEVIIADQVATLRNTTVQFPTGNLGVIGQISLHGKRPWQLQLTSNGIPLSVISPNSLSGQIFGMFKLNSPTGGFKPQAIAATGNLDLRLDDFKDPITANLAWNGTNLTIPRLQVGNYLSGSGLVNLLFNQDQIPQSVAGIDVNLQSAIAISQLQSVVSNILAISSINAQNYRQNPQISRLLAANLDGNVKVKARLTGALDRLQIQSNLELDQINLAQVAQTLIPNLRSPSIPKGRAKFDGNIDGFLDSPKLDGILKLTDLKIDNLKIDRTLAGLVAFDFKNGLVLDLKGQNDQVALKLDAKFQPISANIALGSNQESTIALVATPVPNNPKQLNLEVRNFPIAFVAAIAGFSNLVDGKVSSRLLVTLGNGVNDLNNLRAIGDFRWVRPRFGRLEIDQISSQIAYGQGRVILNNGALNLPESDGKYKFNIAYTPNANPQIQGQLQVKDGKVVDIFNLLQWQELGDIALGLGTPNYGKAEVLRSLPRVAAVEQLSFYQRLQYLSQIQARRDQKEAAAETIGSLPSLSEFKGSLDGNIQFRLSSQTGLGLGFDLVGNGWEYGKFAVDDVKAKGKLNGDVLSLDTVKLQSGDRRGEIINAKISLRKLDGKIELANFPIESLRPLGIFNNLPVEVAGNANGSATISGGLFNPQSTGQINLADASINRQPLKSVGGDFDYKNGRFKFKSQVIASEAEPVLISGDVPYQICPIPETSSFRVLCNLAGKPSENLKIDIAVKNEGLAFINVLNIPLRWLSGIGEGMIAVTGTLRSPQVKGDVTLGKASFQVVGFPGDLTNVEGKVTFNFDRLNSDLKGDFSQGAFFAKGILAIANPNLITTTDPDYSNPLTVIANRLKIELKSLYAGIADGLVTVRGSLLVPELAGNLALSEGRIILGEQSPADGKNLEKNQFNLAFNNLLVKLGDNIQVTQFPLLNVIAKGELRVNGSLNDVRPEGRIRVERGQINAISTRLRIDRDYENYADFVPSQGLSPNLNVRVTGTIPEVTRSPLTQTPIDSLNPLNVPVSNLGAQRTLQIQATVTGSLESPNIDLRSSPPRTQSEILTLIGGGLLQQGGSDPTAVLANLAGNTVIGLLQDAVGDALDLVEFNLSPSTTSTAGSSGISNFGLAAEAAIAISRSFSVAIRAVLNDSAQPTVYTLRYRINPNSLVRTNTDFKGNNSASFEFESRF